MADHTIILPDDSANTGPKLDTSQLTVGANTVQRERMNIADPTTDVALAAVTNSAPTTEYGLVTRAAGATKVSQYDGTNTETTLFDGDSGAGSQFLQGVGLRKIASGGSVEAGTSADPLRIDPTGTTTQPVSATNLDIRDLTAADVVTANLSATDNTVLDNIDADTSAIQTAVELIDDTVATLGTTTYAETTTKGLTIGAVRRDADTTLVGTTNEIGPLQMDANGRLKVEAFSGETLPVSLASTTITGTVAVTQSGTWDEVGINDSNNSITVDNSGTFAVQIDAAAVTSLALIDDPVYTDDTSTHATGTSKIMGIGCVADPTDAAVNANDIGMPAMNTTRFLKVIAQANSGVDIGDVDVASIATGDNNIGNVDIVTMPTVTANATLSAETTKVIGTVRVQGNVGGVFDAATAASVPANAVLHGNRAATANPTAVTDGQLVGAMADKLGRTVVVNGQIRDLVVQQTTSDVTGNEVTILTAGAASVFHDIVSIHFANTSATGVLVSVRDATAGTAVDQFYVPATQTVGKVFTTPFKQTTAANNWTMDSSSAITTLYCTVQAVKNL